MKLAYDIGAHKGDDTARYLKLGYNVIAIEASPALASGLADRFSDDIKAGRVTLLNIAVSDCDGTLDFYLSELPLWNSLKPNMASREGLNTTKIQVPARHINDVIAQYGQPDFLKIDIEGMDYQVLRAMTDSQPHCLSFEADRDDLIGSAEMIMLMAQRGYSRFRLVGQSHFNFVTLPTPGSAKHVIWSARQLLRTELNKRKRLHDVLVATVNAPKQLFHRKGNGVASSTDYGHASSGPTPMEHNEGWHSFGDFMWLWGQVVHSGIIKSTWYDIHAVRD